MGGVVVLLPLTVGHFFGLASFGVLLGTLWMINAIGGALGTYVSGLIYDSDTVNPKSAIQNPKS